MAHYYGKGRASVKRGKGKARRVSAGVMLCSRLATAFVHEWVWMTAGGFKVEQGLDNARGQTDLAPVGAVGK